MLLSIMAMTIFVPTNNVPGSLFLPLFSNTCCNLYTEHSHSNACEMISQHSFDLHVFDD